MDKIFSNFNIEDSPSSEIITKYTGLVPDEIISVWKQFGFGSFYQGYLRSVNPDEYVDLIPVVSKRYKEGIVLFATGMGDLIIWADGYVRLLNFRYGQLVTLIPKINLFFKSLESEKFKEEYMHWSPFLKAIEMYGQPKYDECFGYVPLLGLGGAEKVENLEKAKLREHILLITELMGPIE